MDPEILRLKREFREKWSFQKQAEVKRLLKAEGKLDVTEYLFDQLLMECEIAKLARVGYSANMVEGPLLGDGCKIVFPWGREGKD